MRGEKDVPVDFIDKGGRGRKIRLPQKQIKPAIILRGIPLNDMKSYFRWSRLKLSIESHMSRCLSKGLFFVSNNSGDREHSIPGESLGRPYRPALGSQAVFLETAVGFVRNGSLDKFPSQELYDGFLEIAAALRMTKTFQ